MEKNHGAELEVNGASIELNPFTEQFLTRTVVGVVSSLKEAEKIRDFELHLEWGMSSSSSMRMNFTLPPSPGILSSTQ